jgi:hypothetical protein
MLANNWLGHQIHVGNETEPKYAAHLTIPNLYVGDRVDVTVLEKRLAEGSPDNAAFRARIMHARNRGGAAVSESCRAGRIIGGDY